MKKKILVVDDEPSILELIEYNLESNDYQVSTAKDGQEAFDKVNEQTFDLMLLDQMLPKMSGIEVLKKMRKSGNLTPVIFLTAVDSEDNKIEGLVSGADDYVTKPFSIKELLARIEVVLRRTSGEKKSKTFELNTDVKGLILDGKEISLTKKEYELLEFLIRNKGIVVSREQIFDNVWGINSNSQMRMVDIQISHLRDKIEQDTKNPQIIKTVHGFGYILEV
ncbi:response regulator transcription factor [Companilactobacillus pabuli]|jgi:Response regulators consisting of a CheY-like receiver domain and a winged-helix DNA-binding domain|uniref:Response regulator transcription factor n=1 Tax=Companilactobacillus pabuli TaxID=2714036 RepID=A0A7L7KUS6_9LACO|nr:response regulator transcription factor [Companilactobacillus pabuli]AKP03461.1 PhoP family transcriptional regulator [Companilactobacillus farciminis]AKS51764.1 PhoP family transcriptional regulator [Companilactobacillus farciminis]MDG5112584.1 response regulator transcription factor [Companilactobacillus pabuli]QMT83550.1 response regulator transcription factor [Companilactobacillus pabuli]GAQ01157.1 PhoP family transcriptional regulator [Companilactobacillus farciminis]